MSPEKLGQHFLTDAGWQNRIAGAIGMNDSVWVEIGAGHGELTLRLAQHASKVIAIELDPRLARRLREVTAHMKNVEVVESDVLAVDFEKITRGANFSVYGSLPYYITSPILHRLFEYAERIHVIHIVCACPACAGSPVPRLPSAVGETLREGCGRQVRVG